MFQAVQTQVVVLSHLRQRIMICIDSQASPMHSFPLLQVTAAVMVTGTAIFKFGRPDGQSPLAAPGQQAWATTVTSWLPARRLPQP